METMNIIQNMYKSQSNNIRFNKVEGVLVGGSGRKIDESM